MVATVIESPGMRVRIERVRRGLSQQEVARSAELAQSYVSTLERDLPVSDERRDRILRVLGLEAESQE